MINVHPIYIVASVFCTIATILITCQVYKNPNRLRMFVLFYSIVTLPAAFINVFTVEGALTLQADALTFVISTLLKVVSHFLMVLSVGYRLRMNGTYWKHPLILMGIFFLICTVASILLQIGFVIAYGQDIIYSRMLFFLFIIGLICAILADILAFTYTFLPLIRWKEESRDNEGHARTTALGIWFFATQWTCYAIQVSLYIWFLASYFWGYFVALLAADYTVRFVQNLLYTWPPPKIIINFIALQICSSSTQVTVNMTQTPHP